MGEIFLRFELCDFKSLAICDLRFGALRASSCKVGKDNRYSFSSDFLLQIETWFCDLTSSHTGVCMPYFWVVCHIFYSLVGRFARIHSRLARESRIFSDESILASKKKTIVLQIDLPKKGIPAARTGRESREAQRESERRRDSRESGQALKK